jgi:hypothetical protein
MFLISGVFLLVISQAILVIIFEDFSYDRISYCWGFFSYAGWKILDDLFYKTKKGLEGGKTTRYI